MQIGSDREGGGGVQIATEKVCVCGGGGADRQRQRRWVQIESDREMGCR